MSKIKLFSLTSLFALITVGVGAGAGIAVTPPSHAAIPTLAHAADASLTPAAARGENCFRFQFTDTPAAEPNPAARTEIWCYAPIDQRPGATFIYNADDKRIRTELTAIVDPDGSVTHASLLAGELSYHRIKADFNPLPVPLETPENQERIPPDELHASVADVQEAIEHLLANQPVTAEELRIEEGEVRSMVSAAVLPWRGYWWPHKSQRLFNGSDSPMAKYDRYVKARTGRSPGAVSWERSRHNNRSLSWAGHCNGWAASSILQRQPRTSRRDPMTGVTFSVSDQKGLLAEADYCAKVAFFGKRYNGPGDNIRDIAPGLFHKTLLYYIGRLGKPVAFDRRRDSAVYNNVISGYTMDVRKTGAGRLSVTARVKVHSYDSSRSNTPGVAPSKTKTYRYEISQSGNGGRWLSENPDFLWVPLSPSSCTGNSNPNISDRWVNEIISGGFGL
jgi:hypothetical protein